MRGEYYIGKHDESTEDENTRIPVYVFVTYLDNWGVDYNRKVANV